MSFLRILSDPSVKARVLDDFDREAAEIEIVTELGRKVMLLRVTRSGKGHRLEFYRENQVLLTRPLSPLVTGEICRITA